MKKKLRFVPLATAALLALGMSSVSAKTIYYSTDASNTKMKAFDDAANPSDADINAFRQAQNKGWNVVVKDGAQVIDWTKAAAAKQNYAAGLATAYPAYEPISNGDGTYKPGNGTPVQKEIKSVTNPADITIAVGGQLSLPQEVDVVYSDNTTGKAKVTWNTSAVDTTKAGTYTATGTVEGTTQTATVKVVVTAANTSFATVQKVEAGTGLTNRYVEVTLDTATPENYKVEVYGKELKWMNGKFVGVVYPPDDMIVKTDDEIKADIQSKIKVEEINSVKIPAATTQKVEAGTGLTNRYVEVTLDTATPENYKVEVYGKELKWMNDKFVGVVYPPDDMIVKTDDEIKADIQGKIKVSKK